MRFNSLRVFGLSVITLLPAALFSTAAAQTAEPRDPARLSTEFCVGCHGPNLAGGPAPSLIDSVWKTGSDDESILRAIRVGNPQANMPPYETVLTDEEQRGMLTYIRRLSRQYALGAIPTAIPPPD